LSSNIILGGVPSKEASKYWFMNNAMIKQTEAGYVFNIRKQGTMFQERKLAVVVNDVNIRIDYNNMSSENAKVDLVFLSDNFGKVALAIELLANTSELLEIPYSLGGDTIDSYHIEIRGSDGDMNINYIEVSGGIKDTSISTDVQEFANKSILYGAKADIPDIRW